MSMASPNSNHSAAVNKSDIINELKEQFDSLPQKVVNIGIKTILDTMSDALREETRIEIRGFGSFSVVKRKERIACNPRTGEKVYVKSKNVPHFKPGKQLKILVNHLPPEK